MEGYCLLWFLCQRESHCIEQVELLGELGCFLWFCCSWYHTNLPSKNVGFLSSAGEWNRLLALWHGTFFVISGSLCVLRIFHGNKSFFIFLAFFPSYLFVSNFVSYIKGLCFCRYRCDVIDVTLKLLLFCYTKTRSIIGFALKIHIFYCFYWIFEFTCLCYVIFILL